MRSRAATSEATRERIGDAAEKLFTASRTTK